ncbi:uncharacterized protein LOC100378179 [Saccoglossus kowalevskii]|uniref:Uncharacterized protein LOC100378179 n=1 Tax=Saccoglossus kowalevskii TaxID=10224 RepID=A0ABM0GUI0_SACKO|nr:PREDICTED: uncharacterized protein LOC100378179 [Saccoglossus kowalevskii]
MLAKRCCMQRYNNISTSTLRYRTHMSRVFAISDIHVDHPANLDWINGWSDQRYRDDVLIVAGDVTDYLPLLESTLSSFKKKFKSVFYVPGNHELWLRKNPRPSQISNTLMDSIQKFQHILSICDTIGVHTTPQSIACVDNTQVMIVPLFSWYSTPETDEVDSLYLSGPHPDNVEKMNKMWMDNHFCVWPHLETTISKHFAALNNKHVKQYSIPVISFSHFLPRQDLILACKKDEEAVAREQDLLSLGKQNLPRQGSTIGFNFTRFAGCKILETQIRRLCSQVHVYGHQHRNRDRDINGVRYVSHCLGYKRERDLGLMWGLVDWEGPKLIWPLQ